MLGVQASTLQQHGVASLETAQEMAKGVLIKGPAHISMAITGIAGPNGGTKEKPVGTLYFAWAHKSSCESCVYHFDEEERLAIRYAAVAFALKKLIPFISIASQAAI